MGGLAVPTSGEELLFALRVTDTQAIIEQIDPCGSYPCNLQLLRNDQLTHFTDLCDIRRKRVIPECELPGSATVDK